MKWRELDRGSKSYTVTGGACWRKNGNVCENAVLFVKGESKFRPGEVLYDVESQMCMTVLGAKENGGYGIMPIYSSPLKWWQRFGAWLFRLRDEREHPPCVKHGSVVLDLGEAHVEGSAVPSAYRLMVKEEV